MCGDFTQLTSSDLDVILAPAVVRRHLCGGFGMEGEVFFAEQTPSF
jgi:hypothetical protein